MAVTCSLRKMAGLLLLLTLLQTLCHTGNFVSTVNGETSETFLWQVYYEGNDESAYRFDINKNISGLEIWLYINTDDRYAELDRRFDNDWIELTLVSKPILVITADGQYVVEPIVGFFKIGYKGDGKKSVGGIHAIYYILRKNTFVSYVNITLHAPYSTPRLDVLHSYVREWNPNEDIVQLETQRKGWVEHNVTQDCRGRVALISFGAPVGDQPMTSGLTWYFGKRISPPKIAWKPDIYVEVGYAGGINLAPEMFAGTGSYKSKINVGVGCGFTLEQAIATGLQQTVYMIEKGDGPTLVADEAASGSVDVTLEVLQKISKSPAKKAAFEALGYTLFVLDIVDIVLSLNFDERVDESQILVFEDFPLKEDFFVWFNFYAEIATAGLCGGVVNFWGECPFGSSVFDNLGFNVVNLPTGGMQIGDIVFDYHDPYPTSGSLITINPDGYVSPLTPLIVSEDFRVYNLINNAEATIVIKRDNIILDGCGHRLKGGVAVVQTKASCRENVTVKSMRIEGGLDGLELYHATGIWPLILESYEKHGIFLNDVFNVAIINNTIVGCQVGVALMGANSCTISGNNIAYADSGVGIYLSNGHYCVATEHNVISENIVSSCGVGIFDNNCWGPNNITRNCLIDNVEGVRAEGEMETISYNNLIQCRRGIIGVGQEGNKVILGNTILNCSSGIDMFGSSVQISRNRITNCVEFGIRSKGCNVSKNEVLNCTYGIVGGGTIFGNNITNCIYGISYSYGNITHNNIAGASVGIYLTGKEIIGRQIPTVVQWNKIVHCHNGTFVEELDGIIIHRNNYIENKFGICMSAGWNRNHVVSENNFVKNNVSIFIETDYLTDVIAHIFHNNFIENGRAYGNPPRCVWDNGYPAGGNYWSDYVGVDEKSGINQDQPGKDGIGDKPYLVSGKAVDRYPLMEPTSELPLMKFSYIVEGQTVLLTSNSGISNFKYNLENKTLSFQVQGKSGTKGFVNLDIPKNIADGQVEVLFDGKPIPFNKSENVDRVNINFVYEHSKHYVKIRFRTGEGSVSLPTPAGPEFQWGLTWAGVIIIVVFMIAVALIYYTKRKK